MKRALAASCLALSAVATAQQGGDFTLLGGEHGHRVSAALGDVDGDGLTDLMMGGNGSFSLRRGVADRGSVEQRLGPARPLGREVGVSCENPGQPHLADLDGDGDLDLLAIDTHLGSRGYIVWFANDGRGNFAPATALLTADGTKLACEGNTRAVAVTDWDGDGHADLLIAVTDVCLHAGGPQGFAAAGRPLGAQTRGGMAIADWNGDGSADLLLVADGHVVMRERRGTELGAEQVIRTVAGDSGLVNLAVADLNGDGKPDLLLGETTLTADATPAAAATAEERALQQAAQKILDLISAEQERINKSKPPLADAAAMAQRAEHREELRRWADGPRAILARAGRGEPAGRDYASRVQVVLGR